MRPQANHPIRLRQQLAEAYASDRPRVATAFVQDLVQRLSLSSKQPEPASRFLDAGLDSLTIVEMSSQLQAEIDDGQGPLRLHQEGNRDSVGFAPEVLAIRRERYGIQRLVAAARGLRR